MAAGGAGARPAGASRRVLWEGCCGRKALGGVSAEAALTGGARGLEFPAEPSCVGLWGRAGPALRCRGLTWL